MAVLLPVVLSGGAGSRLWPVSREALPKPFIRLPDGENLLRKTLRRAAAVAQGNGILVVTNREYFFLTGDEYAALGKPPGREMQPPLEFLLEPAARNTAPAICAAALEVARARGEDAVLLVLPADHLIHDEARFREAVAEAARLAREGWLVTFGIAPTRPETGFGYVEAGEALSASASKVARFVEKPDLARAQEYVAQKRFSWNSGMFCFAAGTVLAALRRHAPGVVEAVEATLAATDRQKQPLVLAQAQFAKAPDVSFDYAVMEKAEKVAVVRAGFDWNDVGSWSALGELRPADASGNTVATEHAVTVDARGNILYGSGGKGIAAVGVEDLVIVATDDAVLVMPKSKAQQVRDVVKALETTNKKEFL